MTWQRHQRQVSTSWWLNCPWKPHAQVGRSVEYWLSGSEGWPRHGRGWDTPQEHLGNLGACPSSWRSFRQIEVSSGLGVKSSLVGQLRISVAVWPWIFIQSGSRKKESQPLQGHGWEGIWSSCHRRESFLSRLSSSVVVLRTLTGDIP